MAAKKKTKKFVRLLLPLYFQITENVCSVKLFFFRIWGFRGIGNFFWGGSVFEESWADARMGQTFIQWIYRLLLKAILSKNSPTHEAVEGLFGFYFFSWSSEDGIKEKRRGQLQYFVGRRILR